MKSSFERLGEASARATVSLVEAIKKIHEYNNNFKEKNIMENNKYYIVRTDRAGVFFGKIKERNRDEITMTDVRKIWHWDGACAVEQLAIDGTKKPYNCKFTVIVPEMIIADPIQIIPCTDKAVASLSGVEVWQR